MYSMVLHDPERFWDWSMMRVEVEYTSETCMYSEQSMSIVVEANNAEGSGISESGIRFRV